MKHIVLGFSLLFCLLVLSNSAMAYYSTPGDVVVGNEVIMRIRDNAGGYSVEERVKAVNERLVEILSYAPVNNVSVSVHLMRGNYVISVGKYQLITVDKNMADANNTTMEKLAKTWAEKLLPALKREKPNI
ncbi:MAG: hypothetical protein ABRQ39_20540 [Candidatus Eremiobacterota bacterium]